MQQDQAKFTLDFLQEKESENKQKKEEYMKRQEEADKKTEDSKKAQKDLDKQKLIPDIPLPKPQQYRKVENEPQSLMHSIAKFFEDNFGF